MKKIRNVAIIAHVDHGKTTLVDQLLKQAGAFKDHEKTQERALDRHDLEKERGITILAKCTSVQWNDATINIIDTPGHSDFGGEVERILTMVDGVLVLVDAAEGPMPQTKFVLSKALQLGLKPLVIINKVDRPDARIEEVIEEIYNLFINLDANNDQINFPLYYASGRNGWAVKDLSDARSNLHCLFEGILEHISSPKIIEQDSFSFLITLLESDAYLGKLVIGKVFSGQIKTNDQLQILSPTGENLGSSRVNKIMAFESLSKKVIDSASAGDIIALAGFQKATVSHTLCSPELKIPLVAPLIDPPTLSMTFSVNTSSFAGLEGSKVTSRMILDRLLKEEESNVSIQVKTLPEADSFQVSARGELQLSILLENMRREGFEISVSKPQVVLKEENGETLEPYEEVLIDVDDEFSGIVIEHLSTRKADLISMQSSGNGRTRLIFEAPSRSLIGYHSQFLTDTRGSGLMNRSFLKYAPFKGSFTKKRNGVLISNDKGVATAYSLVNLEERGILFIKPGTKVYQGMIIGEHNRENDLDVNVIREKHLTNVRASGKDDNIKLTPPRLLNLEEALTYIEDDELVEITPENIRLRKKILSSQQRK